MSIKLTNAKLEKVFNALYAVDRASKDLDFGIRFQNKNNFKVLKQAYMSLTETFEDIFAKYWEKVNEDNKVFWRFWENKDIVNEEIKKIYAIEVELALTPVKVVCKQDPVTQKTDTLWLVITSDEMDILEDIFFFNMQ